MSHIVRNTILSTKTVDKLWEGLLYEGHSAIYV